MSTIAAPIPLFGEVASLSKVYFGTDWCNIKIGRSINSKRRGGELRISILFDIPGGLDEERRHQSMWEKHRIGTSEWFRADDELLLWLAVNAPDDRARGMVRHLAYSTKRRAA